MSFRNIALFTLPITFGLLTGCYSYVPVGLEAVSPGQKVRAGLTTEVIIDLERQLGDRRSSLEGEVVERSDDSILVEVPWDRNDPGLGQRPLRQRIRLSQGDILELELRSLDRTRTAGFAVAVGAAVGALLLKILGGDAGSTIVPGPPNGEV